MFYEYTMNGETPEFVRAARINTAFCIPAWWNEKIDAAFGGHDGEGVYLIHGTKYLL